MHFLVLLLLLLLLLLPYFLLHPRPGPTSPLLLLLLLLLLLPLLLPLVLVLLMLAPLPHPPPLSPPAVAGLRWSWWSGWLLAPGRWAHRQHKKGAMGERRHFFFNDAPLIRSPAIRRNTI